MPLDHTVNPFKVKAGVKRERRGVIFGRKRRKRKEKKNDPAPFASSLSLLSHHPKTFLALFLSCLPLCLPISLFIFPVLLHCRTGSHSLNESLALPQRAAGLPSSFLLFHSTWCDSLCGGDRPRVQTWMFSGPGQVGDTGNGSFWGGVHVKVFLKSEPGVEWHWT